MANMMDGIKENIPKNISKKTDLITIPHTINIPEKTNQEALPRLDIKPIKNWSLFNWSIVAVNSKPVHKKGSNILILLVLVLSASATSVLSSFITPALAYYVSREDRMSLGDPLQDPVTMCHIPFGNRTNAHNIVVGESRVPDHLARGDRIGHCLLAHIDNPTIKIEPPASCYSTENGLVAYSRMIMTGFPIGSVVMKVANSFGLPAEIEVQSDTESLPIGFYTGEHNLTVFSDTNRNLKQDLGEISVTKTFTVGCFTLTEK
jgi:hypothetical protein